MSVLTGKLIKELAETKKLIEPFNKDALQPASYDLAVGRHVLLGPLQSEITGRAANLEKEPGKTVKIKSGQFAATLTQEYLRFPLNICARLGIKSKFTRQGLIAFGGLQADPGWSGHLSISLFNVGPEDIELKLGERMFSIEFHKLEGETEPYKGEYQDQRYFPPDQLNHVLTVRTTALAEIPVLRERIAKLESAVSKVAKIEEKPKSQVESLEEVSIALIEELGLENPEIRADLHMKLCQKYLQEAEKLLAREDFVQASEKAWGAAAQVVKSSAAKRGKELLKHAALHSYVAELERETKDPEIGKLWASPTSLHQNFYENWLPSSLVRSYIEDVKKVVEKVRNL